MVAANGAGDKGRRHAMTVPMRLAYPVLWSRPGRRASDEQSIRTVAALARRGHEIALLVPRGPADPALDAEGLRARFGVTGDFRVVQRPSRWGGDALWRSLMWLRQLAADPEVRGADLVYSRIPAMLGAGQRAPVPFATDHYRPWPDRIPAIRPLIRRTGRHPHCAGLIVHSDYAARAYRRLGIAEGRLLVAHNGFDPFVERLDSTVARVRRGLPGDRPVVAYAGRLDRTKGLAGLLALAALRPDILFVLIGSEGDGPIERAAAGRSNVRIESWAEGPALAEWLQAADILVIPPSRAPLERFGNCVLPMKLFAYLAAGRPILAPESPDTAELLVHGVNAWLVAPDRPAAAAEALDRLLADSPLRNRLASAALELSAGFSWDHRAARITAFLERRLAEIADAAAGQRSAYRSTVSATRPPMTGAAQAPTAGGR